MSVEMRASDEDRQRVIDLLQRHTAAGRLTLDEFSDRVGDVYSARTLGDLAGVVRDLPAETTPGGPEQDQQHHRERRDLLRLFAVAAATLVLLGLLMTLRWILLH
jgi:hypothetical protein